MSKTFSSGMKFDEGKLRHTLFPVEAMEEILEVLEFGAKKYERDNWRYVENPRDRYINAALRHITEYRKGNILDEETGKQHLASAACCLVFLIAMED